MSIFHSKKIEFKNEIAWFYQKNNLLVSYDPTLIANPDSQIIKPGYAIVTKKVVHGQNTFVDGNNLTFQLPCMTNTIVHKIAKYNPRIMQKDIDKNTIEFWIAADRYGSTYIICRYMYKRKVELATKRIWFYDLLALYNDELCLIKAPSKDDDWCYMPETAMYEQYFSLIEHIK